MNIYVSGSIAYDRIMDFPDKFSNHLLPDKLHIINVCFLVNDLEEKFGGTAGNIAYSLSLLQERPIVLASVGSDFDRYKKWMQKYGLSLQGVRLVEDVPTASAYITTDQADNQITVFNPGAMNYSTNGTVPDFETHKSIAIVSPGNLDDMQEYPKIYKKKGIPYIFDPGQNIPAFSVEQLKEMISGSRVLIANEYELNLIMQATGLDQGQLLGLTKAIVTTLGEQGARISENGKEQDVPAVKVKNPVDPTGAGDAFRSGFIKGLCMSKDLIDSAKMGSVCASFCVEQMGTQAHYFTLEDFWKRYEETFSK